LPNTWLPDLWAYWLRIGALMARRAHDLDVVALRKPIGRFPAGTSGTVVSEDRDSALVEVVTDAQRTDGLPTRDLLDDLIDVPYEDLGILRPADTASP
jgi:hypothetical protein